MCIYICAQRMTPSHAYLAIVAGMPAVDICHGPQLATVGCHYPNICVCVCEKERDRDRETHSESKSAHARARTQATRIGQKETHKCVKL